MSSRKALSIGSLAAACLASAGTPPESPALGVTVSAAQVSSADLTIMPDGENLPPGSGDAATGSQIYEANCRACHGERGQGGISDALVGGRGSLAGSNPQQTIGSYWPYATTLFDYVRRAMPYQSPGSLTNEQVYAVTAYLLKLNGVIGENDRMDAKTLPTVRMPNADNFDWSSEAPR